MKIVSSLLLLNLLLLGGCNTLVTRRDLYSPKRGSGYWTERHQHGKETADAGLTRTKPPAPGSTTPRRPRSVKRALLPETPRAPYGSALMITTETPAVEPSAEPAAGPSMGVTEFHRGLAGELFNHVLDLLDRTDRNCSENDRMIHMAHASRFHWELGGTALNIALGEWQCARVHTALGHGDSALYHAWRYLEHAENYGLGPFHVAQAHAALSGAFAFSNTSEAGHHLTLAKEMKAHVSDPEELSFLAIEIDLAAAVPARVAETRPACC